MAAVLMLLLTSCKENQQLKEMHSEADLSGLKVGMMTGTAHDLRLSKRTDITTMKFNLTADALMALSQGKVDVFVEDESSLSSEEMRRLGLRGYYAITIPRPRYPTWVQCLQANRSAWPHV